MYINVFKYSKGQIYIYILLEEVIYNIYITGKEGSELPIFQIDCIQEAALIYNIRKTLKTKEHK